MRKTKKVIMALVLGLLLVIGISPNQASAACNGHGFVNTYTPVYDFPGGILLIYICLKKTRLYMEIC
ncbi:hypothetical protein [Aneurinibacillus sp. REN35]|uniref:hypothetical protein n=1 Tax=Aneurinibacillus sp. REN35 TaxID=3237286 RepID=UPI0035274524